MRAIARFVFERESAHSHTRITFHPCCLNARETLRSRATLPASLLVQNLTRDLGVRRWRGQPCQKHPSTKTTIFDFGKTKSGFPCNTTPRRQPTMPFARNKAIIRISVERFPRPRTRDIRSDLSLGVRVSATNDFHSTKSCFPSAIPTLFNTTSPSATGTAFPICRMFSVQLPSKI